MNRKDRQDHIRTLEYQVLAARTQCWIGGQRPLQLIHRHYGWLAPLGGIAAGLIASKATGRARLSALLSAVITAKRLQPLLMRIINPI
ncbi:MAG: hypothetical protein CMQ46_00235 [Gammaproteobacteria bacterium]|nr:hypothetical protein [Gammaproteobacteria bacterium]MBJ53677.1 hypothetical protein [Gammaproteobacteria bacterium]